MNTELLADQLDYHWEHQLRPRLAGLTDEEIGRIAYGPESPFWNDVDAALTRAVDLMMSH